MAEVTEVDPTLITPSEHNPRLIFDATDLARLRESIAEVGILVPLTVYEVDDEIHLIDGERRLRCALELGLDEVPVLIVDDVDQTKELEWMFSIHMMREEWDDGPVARALKELSERLGGWDNEELKSVTGMSTQRLNYFKALADSPDEVLQRVIDGDLPPNLVADSILRVANPLRRELPDLVHDRTDADFVRAMVDKRDAGKLEDVVAIRDLRTMIRVAAEDVETDEEKQELSEVIDKVISDPDSSIEDAYADTVETRVAAEAFGRSIERFTKSAEHVARQLEGDRDALEQLAERLEELANRLLEVVARLRNE